MVRASLARYRITTGLATLLCTSAPVPGLSGLEITRSDVYTREAKWTGEGAGMWCADPETLRVVIGITTVTTPERAFAVKGHRAVSTPSQNVLVQRTDTEGTSWRQVLRSSDEGIEVDPTCAFGKDGRAYVAAMGWRDDYLRGFNLWRSEDHGVSWSTPLFVDYPEFYDRPFLTVDNTVSRYGGRVYIAAATMLYERDSAKSHYLNATRGRIVVMSSDDRGRTFTVPTYVETDVGNEGSIHMGQTAVFSDGTYLLSWSEGLEREASMISRGAAEPSGLPPIFNFAVSVVRSFDGGRSFLARQRIAVSKWSETIEGKVVKGGKWYPALAVDGTGGTYADNAYLAWNEISEGRSRVVFTRSHDRGAHWNRPQPVAPSPPFSMTDVASGPHQVMTSIAVNANGVIGLSYYELAAPLGSGRVWPMFSYSMNGGNSWSSPVAVTEQPLLTLEMDFPTELIPRIFPTCRWELLAVENGDFMMFPLSTVNGLVVTSTIRLRVGSHDSHN